ncbi:methyl-accepting chemotaxis protein [Paraglaciecola arctica]|uniref:Methyl-accepting chemotaxis protein n=1 Tax=Paraglaciecola arctica BSs20135 TaxID=493475 RepID=K6XGA0_9ALTE|nr:methyl-accepting chemotaxis protein [Paraglaciecola arctica]GAC19684.1 methyl-accepting chemotaxis protein [Paraglaciecola arctica BSs20135]|tara:strand:+ start:3168 stop:4649 length:1482 start_codon:yes stop_codon:yes gene_type:complete
MNYPWVQSANKIFRIAIIVQWLISLGIAFFTSSWIEPFLLGLPILALPIILSYTHASKPISRYAFAIAVQLFAALHIQQAYGMTELHFEIFVMLAFLSYFRDWKTIAIGTGTVAVHHILFYFVQSSGGGLVIFEEGKVAFYILAIHAAFAVIEGVILGFMAKSSYNEAKGAIILNKAVSDIMHQKDALDLKVEIPSDIPSIEEFRTLIEAFKSLIKESNSLSSNVSAVAQRVNNSSGTLNTSVSLSAEQVKLISTSIEEISHSIEDIATRSKESNVHAEEAKSSTVETKTSIEGSSENVSQLRQTLTLASGAIQTLSDKCNNISEVMQSIKSVAEQTNLLALNAAIESARAGEHGRGFAVVADEVRNLAIKSKESAEEIEQITVSLITSANASVTQMNDCVTMVDEAVNSSNVAMQNMDSVINSFQLVSDNITTVATSADKQSTSVKSINDSTNLLLELSGEEQNNVNIVKNEAIELAELCKKLEQQLQQFSV